MEITTPTREARPRGRQPVNVLTPAFVRNVARAGRYGDGRSQSRSSH